MASRQEISRFRETWPEGLATCVQGCLLYVYEDGWMTCVDFGDSNCLCRPIRVMATDSDDVFSNCLTSDCDNAEIEDYDVRVTSHCLEADAERATRTTEISTSSATVLSSTDTTESEFSTTTTSTSSPPTLAPPAPTETNASGAQESNTQESGSQNSGTGDLSPGAKGGIAAGVILGVAALVLLAFFLFRRRRRKALAAGESVAGGSEKGITESSAELEGGATFPDVRTKTTDDPYIAELDAGPAMQSHPGRLSELDGGSTPGELSVGRETGHSGNIAVVNSSGGPGH